MSHKNKVVLVSGGRTSMFLAISAKELYKDDNLLFLFMNTGKERQETLDFIDRCDKLYGLGIVWIESVINPEKGKGVSYKVVDYKTADLTGKPFEDVIKKHGIPSKLYRSCTRDLKERPADKYAQDMFPDGYVTLLGIRADEPHRITARKNVMMPLVDMGVTEEFIRNWWSRQSVDLELKDYEGNCDLCFLKSKRKRLTILQDDPVTALWWLTMENKYGSEIQDKFDVRNDLTITDLVEMSKKPFTRSQDKKDLRDQQPTLFDLDMDIEFSCICR